MEFKMNHHTKDQTLMNQPKTQINHSSKDIEEKIISTLHLNYAESLLDLTNLNEEEKNLKLHNAQQVVEKFADCLGAEGLLQNMLATQLLGIHDLQQKLLSYAYKYMHDPKYGQYYLNAAAKLSNVFIQLVNSLQKLQGNCQQKVVVEHLHINEGGRAIIGQVNSHREGVFNEK